MKCKWKVIKRYIGIIELHYEHQHKTMFSTQHITLYYRPHPQFKRYICLFKIQEVCYQWLYRSFSHIQPRHKAGLSLHQCKQSYDDGRHYQRHHNLTLQTHQTSTYCEEDQSATLG